MFCVLLIGSVLTSMAQVTVADVERLLSKRPVREVVADLFTDEVAWGAIEGGVSRGDMAWLRVAAKLYPGCDAGSCYGLRLALGEALAEHPKRVLQVAGTGFSAAEACSTFGYASDSEATQSARRGAVSRRIKAVEALALPSLQAKKNECLAGLRALREATKAASER